MAEWKWEGISKDGKRLKGADVVKDDKELKRLLRARGIRPLKITSPSIFEMDFGMWLVEKGFAKPFGSAELMHFTKQLSVMVGAGVPILQSLQILFKQEKNGSLKMTIKKIAGDVSSGKSLSETLFTQKGFDKLYCNMIKAGEAGGVLDVVLNKLTMYLEKSEKIKSQIKSALTYPAIVVTVGTLVIYLMLVFVVPKFVEMLKESNQKVPAVTQFVIDASNFLQTWTPLIVPSIFVGLVFLSRWIKTDIGKVMWDQAIMKLPIFGTIVIKGSLSSFARTLSTMLTSGVSLIDSLEICANTVDNSVVCRDVKKIKKGIEEGKTLAEPISEIDYFPDLVSQMIRVGEQTGNLDKMMERVADIFEKEVEDAIQTATKLIEPLILVGLGGVVGLILVAMYMPIFMAAGGSEGEDGAKPKEQIEST